MSETTSPITGIAARDAWMGEHPWHPRIMPFAVYAVFLTLIDWVRPHAPGLYPAMYAAQCGVVLWLLWRYRKLIPELTLRFDWLALPVGAAVMLVWVVLGHWMVEQFPQCFAQHGPHYLQSMSPAARYVSLAMRLVGMSMIVPMLEEPLVRSLVLRSFHRARPAGIAVVLLFGDMPVVGDWFMHTSPAKRADRHDQPLGNMFDQTPLGKLSVFAVLISTLVFMSYHLMRDWPSAIVCSLAYCLLLAATKRKGLGPVIWAHGITNALLWAYCVKTGDWQFL